MIKLLTIVGARPQFIKAAAISRCIKDAFQDEIQEIIVHTGQHYDKNMSDVFFEQLSIPKENYNLEVGSGSHAVQTSNIMVEIESLLKKETPDAILLYGDTNSTLAGALAASKLHFPIIHIEAGVRTYNKIHPEEVNRIICDHLSTLLFVPTKDGIDCLKKEGVIEKKGPYTADNQGVYFSGDIMYDNTIYFREVAERESKILEKNQLVGKKYVLVTVHRPHNTDDINILSNLFETFNDLAKKNRMTFVIPLHPRTKNSIEENFSDELSLELNKNPYLILIDAVSFLDMIKLESNSQLVITDSGGVQKEAYFVEKPALIMLEQTPWPELLETGNALLVNNDSDKIRKGFEYFIEGNNEKDYPQIYGDGKAAMFICQKIISNFA